MVCACLRCTMRCNVDILCAHVCGVSPHMHTYTNTHTNKNMELAHWRPFHRAGVESLLKCNSRLIPTDLYQNTHKRVHVNTTLLPRRHSMPCSFLLIVDMFRTSPECHIRKHMFAHWMLQLTHAHTAHPNPSHTSGKNSQNKKPLWYWQMHDYNTAPLMQFSKLPKHKSW